MDVIEATDLHKSYGDVAAVVGVDLKVAPGEVVAVLGPNGAGKTTTIEMLLGVRSPSRGAVSVFGKPPRHVDVRGRVGAMLQDTDAPESLTVTEMVELVGHYYPYALPICRCRSPGGPLPPRGQARHPAVRWPKAATVVRARHRR